MNYNVPQAQGIYQKQKYMHHLEEIMVLCLEETLQRKTQVNYKWFSVRLGNSL